MADLAVVQRLAVVARVSVLAVLAVAPGRVVSTLLTNPSTLPPRLLEHLHTEAALVGVAVTLTGHAGVGVGGRGSVPGSVVIEVFTDVTVWSGRVVLAHTHCPPIVVTATLGGVAIALAPASHLQV